jgi:mono/diheme cytochrome c family protein
VKSKAKFALAGLAIVAAGGAGAAYSTLQHGFSARSEPTRMEVIAARTARHLAMAGHARELHNPLPSSADDLAEGMSYWAANCAVCHANNGGGDTTIGRNIYPKAPDMRHAATQKLSDGELYYTIQQGIRLTAMPAWGEPQPDGSVDEADKDTWRLVQFIRHLPQLTSKEEKRMEQMNPRPPDPDAAAAKGETDAH